MPKDMRSPLRRAIEDDENIVPVVESICAKDAETGCWVWPHRLDRYGYAIMRLDHGRRDIYIGRAVVKAIQGIYTDEQCHHTCANKACVNPEHLSRVTLSENVAEMMARTSFIRRIAALERALRNLDADHPLLEQ